MKANPQSLVKFLEERDTQFVIPVYQRHYEWRKNEQCTKHFLKKKS